MFRSILPGPRGEFKGMRPGVLETPSFSTEEAARGDDLGGSSDPDSPGGWADMKIARPISARAPQARCAYGGG